MKSKSCKGAQLQGPTNLNKIMPGKAGAKMTKPHRIKTRNSKGGGR